MSGPGPEVKVRPWLLSEAGWKLVQETRYDVAILPWGSTEPHNYHLPYTTDLIQAQAAAESSARIAWEQGARVIVLPGMPFGVQTGQLDLPLCINLNPTSLLTVLSDVVDSLEPYVSKLVIINGHGGNEFKWMIRELQPHTSLFLCLINWYTCIDPKPYFTEPGDHAGELETSVVMHLEPELVLPLEEAGEGRERRFRIEGLRRGWAWAPRQWTQVTADTGVGNPAAASAEKGERFFNDSVAKIGEFLAELAAADPNDLHEPA